MRRTLEDFKLILTKAPKKNAEFLESCILLCKNLILIFIKGYLGSPKKSMHTRAVSKTKTRYYRSCIEIIVKFRHSNDSDLEFVFQLYLRRTLI